MAILNSRGGACRQVEMRSAGQFGFSEKTAQAQGGFGLANGIACVERLQAAYQRRW